MKKLVISLFFILLAFPFFAQQDKKVLYKQDLAVTALLHPAAKDNVFTTHDTVRVLIKNMGSQAIMRNFKVIMEAGDELPCTVLVKAEDHPFPADSTQVIAFCTVDLSTATKWTIRITCDLPGDEDLTNNTRTFTVCSRSFRQDSRKVVDR